MHHRKSERLEISTRPHSDSGFSSMDDPVLARVQSALSSMANDVGQMMIELGRPSQNTGMTMMGDWIHLLANRAERSSADHAPRGGGSGAPHAANPSLAPALANAGQALNAIPAGRQSPAKGNAPANSPATPAVKQPAEAKKQPNGKKPASWLEPATVKTTAPVIKTAKPVAAKAATPEPSGSLNYTPGPEAPSSTSAACSAPPPVPMSTPEAPASA
ncbi:MAG TPA: hypothetical protein VFX30_07520 [bacterium]|nr:hypothetical protein [bacterium]